MIKRRTFLLQLAAGALVAPLLQAQQAGKVYTIGLLLSSAGPTARDLRRQETLRAALRDLGWVEGKNLVIEIRYAGLDPQRQRELATALKALPVALIIASGTITIRAAKDGAPGVPVVMVNAGDPVGAGFVASLARPGGDLSGTSAAGEEVLAKQVELLSAAVPQLKRVSALMNSANPANGFFFDAMMARAKQRGLQLDRVDVTSPGELEGAIARAKGGGLVVLGDPMLLENRERIIALTLRNQVPSIFGDRLLANAGGLMSYLSADTWHWRKTAGFVDKILRGARPADLPVEQPTEFELVINLKTARALGIAIPQSLLLRADQVIR